MSFICKPYFTAHTNRRNGQNITIWSGPVPFRPVDTVFEKKVLLEMLHKIVTKRFLLEVGRVHPVVTGWARSCVRQMAVDGLESESDGRDSSKIMKRCNSNCFRNPENHPAVTGGHCLLGEALHGEIFIRISERTLEGTWWRGNVVGTSLLPVLVTIIELMAYAALGWT